MFNDKYILLHQEILQKGRMKIIPPQRLLNFVNYVRTAGMRTLRLVDPHTTIWIMGNLSRALDKLTGQKTDSSIVSGEMEVSLKCLG